MTSIVHVEVSGLTGSGKSAVMGEIEIALKALGLKVEYGPDFQAEKNGTHADWQTALDLYQPTVVLTERNISQQPQAREDAQPVAGLTVHMVSDGGDIFRIKKWENHGLREGSHRLYTHPAPDALRVAVEAFGVITDLSVNLRQGGPDGGDLNDLSDALNTAVDVAHEALAALQAEQGAK